MTLPLADGPDGPDALAAALGIEHSTARVRAWLGFASGLKWGPSHLNVVNSQRLFQRICVFRWSDPDISRQCIIVGVVPRRDWRNISISLFATGRQPQ